MVTSLTSRVRVRRRGETEEKRKKKNIIRESHTGVGGSQYVSVRIRLCCHQL